MKNAITKWFNYLIGLGLIGIVLIVALVPYFAIDNKEIWPKVFISYVCLFSAVVYIGGGFITQDIYRAFQRKKTKNWDYPLEQVYVNQAWRIFFPFLFAGIVLLIAGLISYPFLV